MKRHFLIANIDPAARDRLALGGVGAEDPFDRFLAGLHQGEGILRGGMGSGDDYGSSRLPAQRRDASGTPRPARGDDHRCSAMSTGSSRGDRARDQSRSPRAALEPGEARREALEG